jgi:hypothetical protein
MRAVSRKEINVTTATTTTPIQGIKKESPIIQEKIEIKKEEIKIPEPSIVPIKEKVIPEEKKTENTTSPFSYIRLLEEIKKIKSTLVLDLKTARFEIKENNLTFIFSKEWHYNRTNDPSMKTLIAETLA